MTTNAADWGAADFAFSGGAAGAAERAAASKATRISNKAARVRAGGMAINVRAEGIMEADQMIAFLRELGAGSMGAILHGRTRAKGGITNADVIRYLAEGTTRGGGTTGRPQETIQRDLGPTQNDASMARGAYMLQVNARLRTLTYRAQRAAGPAGVVDLAKIKAIAEAAQSAGLRFGANIVAEQMRERAENQMTVHSGSEEQADAVEQERYAPTRKKKYGVGALAVYKATGQLLRNLGPGNVRLVRRPAWLTQAKGFLGDEIKKRIGVAGVGPSLSGTGTGGATSPVSVGKV